MYTKQTFRNQICPVFLASASCLLAINIKLIHLTDSNVPDSIKFREHHCKRLELIRLVVSADLHPKPLKKHYFRTIVT